MPRIDIRIPFSFIYTQYEYGKSPFSIFKVRNFSGFCFRRVHSMASVHIRWEYRAEWTNTAMEPRSLVQWLMRKKHAHTNTHINWHSHHTVTVHFLRLHQFDSFCAWPSSRAFFFQTKSHCEKRNSYNFATKFRVGFLKHSLRITYQVCIKFLSGWNRYTEQWTHLIQCWQRRCKKEKQTATTKFAIAM